MDSTIFSNGLIFDYAYRILNEKLQRGASVRNPMDMALIVPVAVNCAFSCELILKSLLPSGTHGHKLYHDLFKKLDSVKSNSIQDETVKAIQIQSPQYTTADFERDMIAYESSFEQWRYFHEDHPTAPSFDLVFMSAFQASIKAVAKKQVLMERDL